MGWDEDKKDVVEKIDKITTAVEAIVTQSQGREDLLQGFKTEIGDVRTQLKELGEKGVDPESLKKIVDRLDELGDTKNISSKPDDKGGAGDDKDWDESKLSEEAKAKADEIYKGLNPEQKAVIANNPEKRKSFLETAQEATSSVPDSLFSEPKDEENTNNEFRKLFNLTDREAGHVPSSSGKGSSFTDTSGNQEQGADTQKTKRLPGGSIPRGNRGNKGD